MAKILIIEDNDFVSRMYANIFSLENYDVQVASSGEEGIKKAKEINPDIILLDIIMPKMNGIEALQHLKEDNITHDIPVIMLTVVGDDDTIDLCFKQGASGYLLKTSMDPEKVLSEVKMYLDKKSTPIN